MRATLSGLAVVLLLLMAVVPAQASSGPTALSDVTVSPRSALTTDTIDFSVHYRNREGSPATWVVVKVDGTLHAMKHESGDDWKRAHDVHAGRASCRPAPTRSCSRR